MLCIMQKIQKPNQDGFLASKKKIINCKKCFFLKKMKGDVDVASRLKFLLPKRCNNEHAEKHQHRTYSTVT